jgi:AcrR family transcriptional regulator
MSSNVQVLLSPRERRSLRTRTAILDAALTIINNEGLGALSVRRIAREIDYSPAALYEYFKNKEDIIDGLCRKVDSRLAEYLNENTTPSTLSSADRLIEIGVNYLRFARENVSEYGILFTGAPPEPGDVPAYGSGFVILLNAVDAFLSPESARDESPANSLVLNDSVLNSSVLNSSVLNSSVLNKEAFAYSCWAFVHGMATLSVQVEAMTTQDLDVVHKAALTRFVYGNDQHETST